MKQDQKTAKQEQKTAKRKDNLSVAFGGDIARHTLAIEQDKKQRKDAKKKAQEDAKNSNSGPGEGSSNLQKGK